MRKLFFGLGLTGLLAGGAFAMAAARTHAGGDDCCGKGRAPITLATCVGAADCKACKNCSSCKHCAKEGGTCGVKKK